MKLRFSLQGMMVLVLFIAVGLAAATAGALPFAIVTLSAATLAVLPSRGPVRAFFVGCSVFGWTALALAFGTPPEFRIALPSTRLIIWIFEAVKGPDPTTFATQEEASRWVLQLVQGVNSALTLGYSLIALAVGLAGGVVAVLIVGLWRRFAGPHRLPSQVVSPIA